MPERLNWLILAASAVATASCLWIVSHSPPWLALAGAVAFAFVNNTPFSVMHEAVHGVGGATPSRNYALGVIAGWMFPTSFSLQRVAHLGHLHAEMLDVPVHRAQRLLMPVVVMAPEILARTEIELDQHAARAVEVE